MTRREHGKILGDVLDNLESLPRRQPDRVNLAGLASSANLPHDRLVEYLAELRLHGLVVGDRLPTITDRGEQFLQCYRGWMRVQAAYGLIELPGMPAETLIGFRAVGQRFAAARAQSAQGPAAEPLIVRAKESAPEIEPAPGTVVEAVTPPAEAAP